MKIDSQYKLEKAASADKSRPVLMCAYLDLSDAEAPVAVATDSYALAIVPVADVHPDDTSGLVPREALEAARKASSKRLGAAEIVANGSVEVRSTDGHLTMARPDGQFPDWRKLMPGDDQPVVYRIALNAEILYKLAQAIGADKTSPVVLEFGANALRPIRVTGAGGAHGLLMPIRTDNAGLVGPAAGAVTEVGA